MAGGDDDYGKASRWEPVALRTDLLPASAKSVQHTIFIGGAHLNRMHFDVVLRKLISQ